MLKSSQVCDMIFDLNSLKKLSYQRLKALKQSCERFQNSFTASCCDMNCETVHIKTDFKQYVAFGGYRTIKQYKNWSTNMTNIRTLLEASKC